MFTTIMLTIVTPITTAIADVATTEALQENTVSFCSGPKTAYGFLHGDVGTPIQPSHYSQKPEPHIRLPLIPGSSIYERQWKSIVR